MTERRREREKERETEGTRDGGKESLLLVMLVLGGDVISNNHLLPEGIYIMYERCLLQVFFPK